MLKTVQMIAVHAANKSGRGKPEFFLPYEAAKEMVDARLAKWNKRGTFINLMKTEKEMPRPALSLSPNVKVMEDFVEGKPHAVAIIDAYAPRFAA